MPNSKQVFSMREILSVVTGMYLTVDKRRVAAVVQYFAGDVSSAASKVAAQKIMAMRPDIANDMPDTQGMKRGAAQLVLIEWATKKNDRYIDQHGDASVTL